MKRLRIRRPSPAMVVALVGLGVAMSGTSYAATGANFVLGKANTANHVSTLTNSAGAALKLTSGGAGTPLSLNAPSGVAPLSVNSTSTVANLDADLLDGFDSSDFTSSVVRQNESTTGPLPAVLHDSFPMTGKLELLSLEGSGYRSTENGPGYVEIEVFACPGVVTECDLSTHGVSILGTAATFSNEVNSHKELSIVLPFTLPQGTYTIGLSPVGNMTTDGTDYYQVSVVSLG